MVLEKNILPFGEWLATSMPWLALVALVVAMFGMFVGFLVTVLRRGPAEAFQSLWRTISEAFDDIMHLSGRRLWAMTWLAIQEALRRRVLVAFAVFVVLLLFAGWFLERAPDDPAKLYLSIVMTTTNFLILILAVFLSTFSLPSDIKSRTVYTVVTKPVRAWEILLGRIFGFTIVGTLLLATMGICSYVFVVRGLSHRHVVGLRADDDVEANSDGSVVGRRTSLAQEHRHTIEQNEDGNLQTDMVMAHQHAILENDGNYRFGPPEGMLQARVPVGGSLRFLDRSGKPTTQGVNVGYEWGYRSYIEGGTLATAIFTFPNITRERFPRERFPDGLPLEMTLRVFRTYKGIIEQRIQGSITLVNPNPNVPAEQRARSTPFIFEPNEFAAKREPIPWELKVVRPNGTTENADLMRDLVHEGELEVWIRCEDRAQYFGVAQNDAYLRASDRPFWVNFFKGYISIWCQMFVMIGFGVMFSTVLSGPVAMMAAGAAMVMGFFRQFITGLATGEVEGGGPIEAMIRVFTQKNLTLDLDLGGGGAPEAVVRGSDSVLTFIMRAVTTVLPNFSQFTTADFVAYGFNIPGGYIVQHLLMTICYFVLVSVTGYFLFKSREIAA